MTLQQTLKEQMNLKTLRENGTAAAEAIASTAQDAVNYASTKSKEAVMTVAKEAQKRAESVKDAAIERGADIADKFHELADGDLSDTVPGRMIGAMADGVTDAANALRGQNLNSIVASTKNFARRNPTLFVAGLALTGFAIMRFARSSQRRAAGDAVAKPVSQAAIAAPRQMVKAAAKPRTPRKAAS